jgi:hypothetical protein
MDQKAAAAVGLERRAGKGCSGTVGGSLALVVVVAPDIAVEVQCARPVGLESCSQDSAAVGLVLAVVEPEMDSKNLRVALRFVLWVVRTLVRLVAWLPSEEMLALPKDCWTPWSRSVSSSQPLCR